MEWLILICSVLFFSYLVDTLAFIDFGAFVAIMYISSMGGQGAMYAGTIASAIFSVFLYFSPPKFLEPENTER